MQSTASQVVELWWEHALCMIGDNQPQWTSIVSLYLLWQPKHTFPMPIRLFWIESLCAHSTTQWRSYKDGNVNLCPSCQWKLIWIESLCVHSTTQRCSYGDGHVTCVYHANKTHLNWITVFTVLQLQFKHLADALNPERLIMARS